MTDILVLLSSVLLVMFTVLSNTCHSLMYDGINHILNNFDKLLLAKDITH